VDLGFLRRPTICGQSAVEEGLDGLLDLEPSELPFW